MAEATDLKPVASTSISEPSTSLTIITEPSSQQQPDTGNDAYDYDSFDEQSYEKPTERWAPLGAAASPTPSHHAESSTGTGDQETKLRELESEQEQLNSSLLALTSHFAQVQLRLKQIVSAPADDKEKLLTELEQFAFRGIPDVRGCSEIEDAMKVMSEKEHEAKISQQREKQKELITQLKTQLEDLETYAYETGNAELPTTKVIEKQKIVIDELKQKIDLDLHDFDYLSPDDLKEVVNHAIAQIVNPGKVKEKLVDQLQTQIVDLERFIQFLQGEASSPGPLGKERCTCLVHSKNPIDVNKCTDHAIPKSSSQTDFKKKNHEDVKETTRTTVKKVLTVLQIYIISQLGCGSREFKRNMMKKTPKGNHWGDLRAKLEVAIEKTIQTVKKQEQQKSQTDTEDYSDDSTDADDMSSAEVVQAVRRDLAMAIKDLIEHGLMEVGQSNSIVPFGCFPSRSATITRALHGWDLLLKFYEMKHGREYNDSPARKLSQSFHLDIVGGKPITAKQTLLGAIDTIVTTHTPLKRSEDSHFKAFICMALNERKLVTWLRLLFRTQTLIDLYYQDWSYVARTGFDDALKALDRLNTVQFKLPVDMAVRPFSKIRDAF